MGLTISSILQNAWNKIKKWGDADFTDEDDIPLATLIRKNEIYINKFKETQSSLSEVGHNVAISTADIVIWNDDRFTEDEGKFNDEGSDESDIEQDVEELKASYSEEISSINTLIPKAKIMQWKYPSSIKCSKIW